MAMILKRLTVSTDVAITQRTGDQVTGRVVHSEPGVRAELLLMTNDGFKTPHRPTYAHVNVEFDVDQVPDLGDIEVWIRDRLIEMLQPPKGDDQ